VAAVMLCAGVWSGAAAAGGDELAAYRELARTPERARLLAIARHAMEAHWQEGAAAADSAAASDWPGPPTGLYVSLIGPRGTRSCVGSVEPMRGTLSASLAALAVEALSADRRRPAIRRDELDSLRIVIAFAGRGEPVADPGLVDPAREGLIVGGADVAVAFLPGEARTIAWALRASRRVGTLRAQQPVTYQRFPAVVLSELEPPRRPTSGGSDVGH
jgi:AMMECR1 domain-containing protein